MQHFVKVDRSHLNHTRLSAPDVNGTIGWEYSHNWHNFPIYLHILNIVADTYFLQDKQDPKKLHMQTITHHENKADDRKEVVLTFGEEMDTHMFLLDMMDGDKVPFVKYDPIIEEVNYLTQIDYCY